MAYQQSQAKPREKMQECKKGCLSINKYTTSPPLNVEAENAIYKEC